MWQEMTQGKTPAGPYREHEFTQSPGHLEQIFKEGEEAASKDMVGIRWPTVLVCPELPVKILSFRQTGVVSHHRQRDILDQGNKSKCKIEEVSLPPRNGLNPSILPTPLAPTLQAQDQGKALS